MSYYRALTTATCRWSFNMSLTRVVDQKSYPPRTDVTDETVTLSPLYLEIHSSRNFVYREKLTRSKRFVQPQIYLTNVNTKCTVHDRLIGRLKQEDESVEPSPSARSSIATLATRSTVQQNEFLGVLVQFK